MTEKKDAPKPYRTVVLTTTDGRLEKTAVYDEDGLPIDFVDTDPDGEG